MATKKGGSKKGGSKKGASKRGASKSSRGFGVIGTPAATGPQVGGGGIDRVAFDRATAEIAQAVKRAVASQPSLGKIKGPIIVGIWYNPRTKQIEVINQLEQF